MPSSTITPLPPAPQQQLANGRPHVPTTSNGRQDLLALKQQLADALGDNGPQYWDALRDFVTGKLNRQEFDFYANLYLSRQNAPLHNAFILATIHNAQKDAPPPANQRSVGWQKRKRGVKGETDGATGNAGGSGGGRQDPKRKKMKRDVMSLGKAERERIKGLAKEVKAYAPISKFMPTRISKMPMIPILTQEKLPPNFNADFSRGFFTPLCYDSKELPNFEALKDRMTTIALEHGLLGGAADDSVEAMIYALEVNFLIDSMICFSFSHIKSIISNVIYKIRANRSMGITLSSKSLFNSSILDSTGSFVNRIPTADAITGSSIYMTPPKLNPTTSLTLGTSSSSVAASVNILAATPQPTLPPTTPPRSSLVSLRVQQPLAALRPRDEKSSITPRDLAFSFEFNPHVLTENPINAERLTSLLEEELEDAEEEEEEGEGDEGEGDEDVFII
ncbi:transcriptional regulator of RNA polII, SAGA, subunit-domain-containing protein [Endogone sp. FLAS-F59071]|nr:transcriptional regulator of RNA polII, SAGA, subunit-domain-containing protein [Endogone sp. FLAS-F59071]|eukprot:RUS14205.1 transcriptional regulator of RNA polII, SAGA, subunit-domain-containing protein [Endogone sp. FLAS-F59071]